ncbi:protease SohB [Dickeya solani]|uniref:Peptidase domain protein n=1 Tax=Dickeya solani D s0432-1 TaxID=1231725 RepID=A0AAV3KEA1_9GAMM|nr:protease SohB [Dickeya solani]ANE77900.1 protease SohB [Dickeya solani IPO 2222]AUH10744.1 protease SohB [Dickeya solani D s0432-1]AYQ47916.1 putative protease SohB [Dickeya solani]AYQ52087.1 putative protease SohB [Dickeya solani]ERO58899.1 Peptidase domain protein [Dickeya solani D s0432-1]
MELLSQYGLFLAKVVTLVVAIGALVVLTVGMTQRKRHRKGELQVINLGEQYREMRQEMQSAAMNDTARSLLEKKQKKEEKETAKQEKKRAKRGEEKSARPCLYVLDFNGSMDAGEVSSLREEVSAVLAVARPEDEVLLRLESPGGVVHGYGLAASQLQRFRQRGIRLTVAVDKVAASGGYMMACVADRIVAAPFAIVGSIGVVAQIPNFNRLLKSKDIDVELHTAGQYKRTLTLFGENTEEGREKFREELNETHLLFKQFVSEMRPSLDIELVATGEHWFGTQARAMGLVDAIGTSDDLLIAEMENHEVLAVRYTRRKRLLDRLTGSTGDALERLMLRWWQRGNNPQL